MENTITIREAVTENDIELFWKELRAYFIRDIFPDPKDGDREYFLSGTEYREHMEQIHDRPRDRCHYLFFCRAGRDIGLALPVIYESEDGKCFLMEFCVLPEYRGNGVGTSCAGVLLEWARERGAAYVELNSGTEQRCRFWQRQGFVPNGRDEWGEPLMLLPPETDVPITVECLREADWQLMKLENGYLAEIGEGMLEEERQQRLRRAVGEEKIIFFRAMRGTRAVGMCSVSRCWSTFACGDTGVFEDLYVEPAFRKKGIARLLCRAAQDWCRSQGIASLTVCCAPCDADMYRSLGFDVPLGNTLAHLI